MDNKMPENKKYRLLLVLLACFISVTGTLVEVGFRADEIRWVFYDSSRLRTTEGKITSSEKEFSGGRNARGWHYQIIYEYSVNGHAYTSDRVNYGYTGSSDPSFANGYVNKYPPGKTVTVFFDPAQPESSVLEPHVKDFTWVYFLLGIYLLSLFLLYLIRYLPD